ncbi:MAG: hypothetical protein HUK08_00350 [Bacteroidaceae bacterium]|nr:hypothetical protein [Bacteroidaceae bacterium]
MAYTNTHVYCRKHIVSDAPVCGNCIYYIIATQKYRYCSKHDDRSGGSWHRTVSRSKMCAACKDYQEYGKKE